MPVCACVPSALPGGPLLPGATGGAELPGGCRQGRAGAGDALGQPWVLPWSCMPQGRLARRVHMSVNAAREHVCWLLGKSSLGARSIWLKRTSCVRGELGHQPGLWLRFAQLQRGLVDPSCPQPLCPPHSRPELCREERGSLFHVPSPPPLHPGGKDAAQGSHAHCAGSCCAAQTQGFYFFKPGRGIRLCPFVGSTLLITGERWQAGQHVTKGAGLQRPRQC